LPIDGAVGRNGVAVQVRCPNCDGYRVTATREYVLLHGTGKKKIVSIGPTDYLLAIVTLGLGYLLAKAANDAVSRRNPPVYGEYICLLCGYKWDSGLNQTHTRSHNPDLLRMGAEQRQREEQAAAAAAAADYERRRNH
jgi:hypothetical protein